ncbi:T9SS type A sorting domain-containing protein [Ulvibacterium marinum]|uniref:T9SS type A sorting domain-containing protein n=1 Tax=Ulvibacterium marinum TaxID=2419782 RepID=UPI002494475D|nr:T9SS type A sorting domain-containing protein [Ulvibacterium marinum]
MIRIIVSYYFLFLPVLLSAQQGIRTIGELPGTVSETSGLIFYNDRLITHNDSGNEAKLFEIDTTSLQVFREVVVSNAQNVDWEDMAQDEHYIYIGDFGNNLGMRRDLKVYRISKEEYTTSDRVSAEVISFEYEDQEDFSNNGNSDWDAEALFVLGNELVVLTKQWLTYGTSAYGIPKTPGEYIARKLDEFAINGLVTGATLNPNTNELYLAGYSFTLSPFLVRVSGISPRTIFTEDMVRINLDLGLTQIEGITHMDNESYFLSSEMFSRTNPSITTKPILFSFNNKSIQAGEEIPMDDPIDSEDSPEELLEELLLFKRFGSDLLEYRLATAESVYGYAIFDTSGRRIQHKIRPGVPESTIDVSTLKSAIYYLTFYFGNKSSTKPFVCP